MCQDAAVSYWLDGGMPSNKLVMTVPMFGECWTLDSEAEHGYYAPASHPGDPGPWTQQPGFMAFAEVCPASFFILHSTGTYRKIYRVFSLNDSSVIL